jgi:hypothetical protein
MLERIDMCKYNKEENKLLGLPEDEECLLQKLSIQRLAKKEMDELLKLEMKEAQKNLSDYFNIKHIPKTQEEMNKLREKIEKKYRNLANSQEPLECKPETIVACKAAEEALRNK